VLEARGLDITPSTIERFVGAGDEVTARILRRILADEVRHVRAGTRWFESACAEENLVYETTWRQLVALHFRGAVKPPFNDSARDSAGLTREYYGPLAAG
jgi:uncharacterized ferritin-like protein (DUF455 family)